MIKYACMYMYDYVCIPRSRVIHLLSHVLPPKACWKWGQWVGCTWVYHLCALVRTASQTPGGISPLPMTTLVQAADIFLTLFQTIRVSIQLSDEGSWPRQRAQFGTGTCRTRLSQFQWWAIGPHSHVTPQPSNWAWSAQVLAPWVSVNHLLRSIESIDKCTGSVRRKLQASNLGCKPPFFIFFHEAPAGQPSCTRKGGANEIHQRKKAAKTLMHLQRQ